MEIGIGMGMTFIGNTAATATAIASLLAEALIPTRDSPPTVISTATVDPITGANVPANTANGRTVNVGPYSFIGAALRADRATTGMMGSLTGSGVGLSSNTAGVGAYPSVRRIVQDGATSGHFAGTAAVALTDGVNYVVSDLVKYGAGSTSIDALCIIVAGGNHAGVRINLQTGALTAYTAGNGVHVRSSARLLSTGFWLVQATVNSPAWGASCAHQVFMTQGGTFSYAGDGVSGIDISGYQVELGDSATPPLAWDGSAGVSRAATSNSWAQSLSTTAGTMFAVGMPYSRAGTVAASTAPRSYESITTGVLQYDAAGQTFTAQRTDAIVNARTVTSASTPAVAGSQKIVVQRWDATSNRITVDGVTTSSAAPTTPFAAATPIFIGNRSALDQAYEGWKFLMLFPRALTDAEVALLVNYTTIV